MIDSERIVTLVADEYGVLKAVRNGVLEPILVDVPGIGYYGLLRLAENNSKTERED